MKVARSRTWALVAAFVVAITAAAPAAAHDFWIEPSTYRPLPLQRLAVRHRVGNHFLGDLVPRDETLLVRFVAVGGDGEQPVPGLHGRDPAGIAQAPERGTLVVAYQSRGSIAEMDATKMAAFVAEEGVADQLPAGWQSKRLVRDRFTRSVKSLLRVRGETGRDETGRGDKSAGFDHVVGLPLELVPLVDPATLGGGGSLPVRLLFEGKPARGIQVAALSRLDPSKPLLARTDAGGRVTFALPRGGEWLLKAVKIVPGGPGADFGSVWATLTFLAGEP